MLAPLRGGHRHGDDRAKQFRTFADLAEKLKMDVTDLMRQCNGKTAPTKALVKGLATEPGLSMSHSALEPTPP